jgi:hypothetical protein
MRIERPGTACERARRQIIMLLLIGSTIAFYPHVLCGQHATPAISYPRDSGHILLSLSHEISRIRSPDTTPLVRVYGDGHVRVHYPIYMSNAGDYELQLSAAEVTTLIQTLITKGIFTFNPRATAEARISLRAARRQRAKTEKERHEETDHGDHEAVQLTMHLDSAVMPDGTKLRGGKSKRTLRWVNLRSDLREFPELTQLEEFDECVKTIKALAYHTHLMRIQEDAPR